MHVLYSLTKVSGLEEAVRKCDSGSILGLGSRGGALDFWPHAEGILRRVPDDSSDQLCFLNGNKEPVIANPRGKCLPFKSGVIVIESGSRLHRGLKFILNGKKFHWQKTRCGIDKCVPHPDGGIAIELEDDKIILLDQDEKGEEKVAVLNKKGKPHIWHEYTHGGVVARSQDRKFFFNGKPIPDIPSEEEYWETRNHMAFGNNILVIETHPDGARYVFPHGDKHKHLPLGKQSQIIALPHIGEGKIIIRDDFMFSVDGVSYPIEIPCDHAYPHPHGVLIERKDEFFLLLVK